MKHIEMMRLAESVALQSPCADRKVAATSDAPCADDFVRVDGRECRVLMVVHERDGWSKVCVTIDRR